MRLNRWSKNYADALLKVTSELNCISEADTGLKLIVTLLSEDPSFRAFYYTNKIEPEKKSEILNNILGVQCHPTAIELFSELSRRKDNKLIYEIAGLFHKLRQDALNELPIKIFSSKKLNQEETRTIIESLKKNIDGKLHIESNVDSSLLGGLKVRIKNRIYDGSLSSRMTRLKGELLQT
jgi:F-type H+-transporting ATPase subunit delta